MARLDFGAELYGWKVTCDGEAAGSQREPELRTRPPIHTTRDSALDSRGTRRC